MGLSDSKIISMTGSAVLIQYTRNCRGINQSINKTVTRSAGQSPTWGRPPPQVRVESQFRYSKFLSQQWQLVNDSKTCIVCYSRTTWHMNLRQLTVYEHFGWVNMRAITFLFVECGPKFITSSRCEDTPTSPEVRGTNTMNFRPDFKFLRSKVFFSWGPKCSLPRKIYFGGSMLASKTFFLWTKVHRTFFLWNARVIAVKHISFTF